MKWNGTENSMQTSEKLCNIAEKLTAVNENLLAALIRNNARQQAEIEEYLENKHIWDRI